MNNDESIFMCIMSEQNSNGQKTKAYTKTKYNTHWRIDSKMPLAKKKLCIANFSVKRNALCQNANSNAFMLALLYKMC